MLILKKCHINRESFIFQPCGLCDHHISATEAVCIFWFEGMLTLSDTSIVVTGIVFSGGLLAVGKSEQLKMLVNGNSLCLLSFSELVGEPSQNLDQYTYLEQHETSWVLFLISLQLFCLKLANMSWWTNWGSVIFWWIYFSTLRV